MPEKSIREMSEFERMRHSIAAKTFRATVMEAVILGIVAFVIGLSLYTYSLVRQYIHDSFNLCRNAAAVLNKVSDVRIYSNQVMDTYRNQTTNERNQCGTDEYRMRFAEFIKKPEYKYIRSIMKDFYDSSDVDDIYLAMYDKKTCTMVYLIDPNREDTLYPGEWETVTEKGMEKFFSWDGKGTLYDIDKTDKYGWLCTSGIPIYGEDGKIAAFLLSDISLANVGKAMRSFTIEYLVAMCLITFLVGYFMRRHFKKALVEPINLIADAAVTYVQDKKDGLTNTEHFRKLNIKTGDEIENLSLIMADMEKSLAEYEDNLRKITVEKERINTELSLATRIQADMLPNHFPAFPDRTDFDIYASMDPAREVGGDFYDFFLIDDDHLCMIMADVSGKGIPAALFMMASKIILANNALAGNSPGMVLEKTNNAICSSNREEMFVTVWIGILDLKTGILTAANAGHEYPVIKNHDGEFTVYKDKHGFVIGGMDGMKYKEYEIQMKPGSKLFLYTDGVPEATDIKGTMFGIERMLEALNQDPEHDAADLMLNVRKKVDEFVQNAEQFDDLTMLCMEYKGKR